MRKVAQFVVATHSPILTTLPGATILSIEEGKMSSASYRDTDHCQLPRDFLNKPERFHRYLFEEGSGGEE